MASHPLKRDKIPRHSNAAAGVPVAYDSLSHSEDNDPNDDYTNEYSDELSGGYDEYDDLNSEAEAYYNSGGSELVTTVR